MAPSSAYYSILQAAKQIVDGLLLADWNAALVPSQIRKLPAVEEGLDALPLVLIVPHDKPEGFVRLSYRLIGVTYRVEVVSVAANNHDLASHLDYLLSWRERIRTPFERPDLMMQNVNTVYLGWVEGEAPIDREKVNNNYDYSGLSLLVTNAEAG